MLAKQFALGIGIAILLPLTIYYGVHLFSPPPDSSKYYERKYEQDHKIEETKNEVEKKRLRTESEARDKRYKAAERRHQQHLFYVAYPVGMLAIIVGILSGIRSIGAGLMFGGIFTLAEGCFSYWEAMPDWTRFTALVLALLVFIGFGYWKFQPKEEEQVPS